MQTEAELEQEHRLGGCGPFVLRSGIVALGLLWGLLGGGKHGWADDVAPAPTPQPVTIPQDVGPPPQTTAVTTVGRYPAPPDGFARGSFVPSRPDHPLLKVEQYPQIGFYLHTIKLLFLVAMFAFWVHYSNWVHEDSRGLKVRPPFWNSWMVLGGVGGFLGILTVPMFAGGFVTMAAAIGAPLGLYIRERNGVVPENRRVMTPDHIKKWSTRQLAKIGIHIGNHDKTETGSGPPIVFVGKTRTGKRDESRSRQVESSKGYMAAKELVYDAIQRRSTDIHLEPKDDELAVRLRIDGVMFPAEPFDKAVGDAVVNIFKVLCAMDITERRRPQDGSFGALLEGREIDFRVASQGTRHGEKLSMRILDQSNSVSTLDGLGMRSKMREKLEQVIAQPHGLFLVCGPTGAGKSTTLYAAINAIDAYERNIITIEDPVEYKMDNVTQIEINQKSGQTFGQSLRSILRQDPDVVMIGEIRDEETAKIACQAANTGHMVFSTVHANDTITALYRLLDLGVEPFMISTSISAILAQRLARRLCQHCREAYRPNPELLKAVGLPPAKVKEFFRPPQKSEATCTHCGGLGYQGRVGVFELLSVNERMRELIREKAAVSAIRNEARKDGMLYMQEEGLRLVVRGVTSVDEVRRVVK
ncbi:MAG: type II/IV secretion system protein [Planctomycetaceae bacterium]|nr:type II/IV secretion system protein [Planctomycetaceae bacterium]